MANKHENLTSLFTDIADAIREKTGGTDSIVADKFPEAISAIDTQEDLDPELATQDDLIAQIAVALEGKTGASGGSSSVETVTGTINFYTPRYPYVFCYEDNNGIINVFETSDDNFHTFNIRKNSIISLHCPGLTSGSSGLQVGLTVTELESVNGIEIISITKLKSNNMMFSVVICKVTDDFSIDWTEDDGI